MVADHLIVEAIRSGRADAQRQLWNKYWPWLIATARQTGLSQEDAEEVVSDVFFRVLQLIAAGRTGNNVGPLLRVATRNAAISRYRDDRPHREHEVSGLEYELQDAIGGEAQFQAVPESSEVVPYSVVIVRQALETLSAKDQQVLTAIACEASNEELAEWFDTNLNNARQLRSRAKDHLRQAILSLLNSLPEAERRQALEKIFRQGG